MGPAGMVLDLVAEFVMGSVCQGQSLSWAEFVMGRDVPESILESNCPGTELEREPSTGMKEKMIDLFKIKFLIIS